MRDFIHKPAYDEEEYEIKETVLKAAESGEKYE